MFNSNVVLVLGAGASQPFGYPGGDSLREYMIEKLRDSSFTDSIIAFLKEENRVGVESGVSRFAEDLKNSNPRSIDQWLSHRNDHEQLIAKSIIASIIIDHENQDKLFESKKSWYEYLYRIMDDSRSLRDVGNNKLTIITFNYDRSLEHFLYTRLISDYGNDQQVRAVLSQISIIHVRGQIDNLPWQDANDSRPYNNNQNYLNLLPLGRNIKIVGEDIPEFKRIREKMAQAEKIYLLGFGFHPENLDVLGRDLINKCQYVVATTYGLIAEERRTLKSMFTNMDLFPGTISELFEQGFHPNVESGQAAPYNYKSK